MASDQGATAPHTGITALKNATGGYPCCVQETRSLWE
ncbi:hypothetical protein SNOG_15346 [Parastagonospora nodorum SN15]|uniref:Uncharacterized protein n=1 Tax=Phaeosphaeria nodorum (strain SN15 / ATCC MYA-4574 / FGSC 10173) TaxID=321614 RepID=Q0TYS1_PHANO|nr:hypothetical protein SNOG_15346 [Parastagonospora nodorum SN15]EAT77279.1 hypothetical protein SNOG_15346 [Parastagonospora nodorum SN15]